MATYVGHSPHTKAGRHRQLKHSKKGGLSPGDLRATAPSTQDKGRAPSLDSTRQEQLNLALHQLIIRRSEAAAAAVSNAVKQDGALQESTNPPNDASMEEQGGMQAAHRQRGKQRREAGDAGEASSLQRHPRPLQLHAPVHHNAQCTCPHPPWFARAYTHIALTTARAAP
jgi:hypothetical protein